MIVPTLFKSFSALVTFLCFFGGSPELKAEVSFETCALSLLCRLPALGEATYRDHFCRLASALASQKISVTFFSETTQASFLIFGTEHQYGELYRVTQF